MRHDLISATYPDKASTVTNFEMTVNPFRTTSGFISQCLMWRKVDLLATPWVMINQRHMPEDA